MTEHAFFETLFEHSRQVTPYLEGQIEPNELQTATLIGLGQPSSACIQTLYNNLQLAHPEAGSAYWLTRTWTLLCWQPIYVAFVAIYSCRGLPPLSSMTQNIKTDFVSGFHFTSLARLQGPEQTLITQAGKQLVELFDYFRDEMSQWTRIRPGFTNHLFADGILGCLVKLSHYYPHLSEQYLVEQGQLWLDACGLPAKLINSLSYNADSHNLTLVRTSCCLVYKCQGRALCRNCPRHPENKV
ncbi:siderophore ferric iron reductase [Vibrio salilacus]|uniref:siderophore ferric iron reductase n=1 Tax=Vibrio salilacus TaxID=1323749 RepID=UPI000C298E2D|nr:siderophore ferric iron reductase [Vibrio salilacus]